jgi:hypothetical protein
MMTAEVDSYPFSGDLELHTMVIGSAGWSVNWTAEELVFEHVDQGRQIVEDWQDHMPKESNWSQHWAGVPSMIVRLDCTILADGSLGVYEVDVCPSGLGLVSLINDQFKKRLSDLISDWPPVEVLMLRDSGGDDSVWLPPGAEIREHTKLGLRDFGNHSGNGDEPVIIVRGKVSSTRLANILEPRSLYPMAHANSKSYGLSGKMGLWQEVFHPSDLDWSKPFVLKPPTGYGAKGVKVWHPEGLAGSSTRTSIINSLDPPPAYMQEYLPPMETGIEDYPMMIYRVYYGFDRDSGNWLCLGGAYTARNNVIIHGARDSFSGPLITKE